MVKSLRGGWRSSDLATAEIAEIIQDFLDLMFSKLNTPLKYQMLYAIGQIVTADRYRSTLCEQS